jgi:hypothetical protein
MSNNFKFKATDNSNGWINWIEEAIMKNYLKYYEHKHFSNIQVIGPAFGKVYRANCKDTHRYLALKSFLNLNNIIAREIVSEM